MHQHFTFNQRLSIDLPTIKKDWEAFSSIEQQQILVHWETIRGKIPDRIKSIEVLINRKQEELSNESDFETPCKLNHEIAELASQINELWLWFRTDQDVTLKGHY